VSGDRADPIGLRQLRDDMPGVGRQPRVEEARREVLRAPAVPLIEPDDAHPTSERLGGHATHVVGVTRRIEAVQQKQQRTIGPVGLPMHVREHARLRRDVEVPDGRLGKRGEVSGPRPAENRLCVAARDASAGCEQSSYVPVLVFFASSRLRGVSSSCAYSRT
jgi:hypothetical protein